MSKEKKEAPASTEVHSNPALVEFPLDTWGMTSELRKAGIRAASSVRGNEEKHKLLLQTLRIIAQHSAARLKGDAAALAARGAKIEARATDPRQRINGAPTALPATPVE